jgi:phosphoglycerol transferase MdoB-like AlkP superfamily enzyme
MMRLSSRVAQLGGARMLLLELLDMAILFALPFTSWKVNIRQYKSRKIEEMPAFPSAIIVVVFKGLVTQSVTRVTPTTKRLTLQS